MFRNDQSILLMMMVFRLFNCMLVQTYYVPDEYWQSLEVAHHQAFGYPFPCSSCDSLSSFSC